MTPEQDIERARRIAAFVGDDYVAGLLADIENEQLRTIRDSAPEERETRESAYLMLRSLKALRDRMHGAINSGKCAQAKINRQS